MTTCLAYAPCPVISNLGSAPANKWLRHRVRVRCSIKSTSNEICSPTCSSERLSCPARPANQLDPYPEKPQTGVNRAPPRVNPKFIERGGFVIREFESR